MALGYSSFVTPTTNLVPTFGGGRYSASFRNTATFTCGQGETCAAGAYRQYVMGSFTANGSQLSHVLCGSVLLSTAVYYEDGCPPNGSNCAGCTAYGYRACTMTNDGYTNPDQANGSDFWMTDAPGFNNVKTGTLYAINLSFQGKLVNTTNNAVLATQTWTVSGSATAGVMLAAVPTAADVAPIADQVGLGAGDKIVGADLTYNLISRAPELQVTVRRPSTAASLSPEALEIALTDGDNNAVIPLGAPEVYEIGNRAGSTATLVYSLADDGPLPELASLTARSDGRLRAAASQVTVLPVRRR